MIASPLSNWLMKQIGLEQTFVALGIFYFCVMTCGALGFRVPPDDYMPEGWTPPKEETGEWVFPKEAIRTRQFYMLWIVLCFNVTAGIGVLGQASAMIQEVFKGRVDADAAAKFVAALSASNMIGRFFWASLSDRIGRKATYAIFFSLGTLLYLLVPSLGAAGNVTGFVICFCAILTMYGGGFATVPAYLADLFGTRFVSAIHGRLLTAWSMAGVLGPVLVNYIRQQQIESGVPKAQAYNVTMRLMAVLLVIGFISNILVKRLESRQMHQASEKT